VNGFKVRRRASRGILARHGLSCCFGAIGLTLTEAVQKMDRVLASKGADLKPRAQEQPTDLESIYLKKPHD
jgi:hypothetical protein